MLQRIFIFILPLIILSTESANAGITLRDAIYLYNQDYYANGSTSIGSYNCDVFQLVLDVEDGYADLNMYRGDTSLSSSKYPDRIYSSASMFSYMLYGADKYKLFSFEDNNGAATSISKIGKGTVFGYCLSSNSDAFVFLEDRAQCIFKFSDGSTSSISNCTPTNGAAPSAPTGTLSDLYGLVTFEYKFNSGTTTYTDAVQFSSANLTTSNGIQTLVNNSSIYAGYAVACAIADLPINGTHYKFACGIGTSSGMDEFLAFNLNGSYQITGIYEYCGSASASQCGADLAASPDGTVWGAVNRSNAELSVKLSDNTMLSSSSDKEIAKIKSIKFNRQFDSQHESQLISTNNESLKTLSEKLDNMLKILPPH